MKQSRKKIVFGCVLFLLVFLLAELGAMLFFRASEKRFTFFEPEDYLVPERHLEKFMGRFDADLGWDYKLDTPHNERPREKDYGKLLISTFGDSYTFCDDVDDDETWQTYLSEILNADVLNYGVNGYGTGQALLRFRRYYPEVKTPIVTLGLITENINRIVNVYRPFYYSRTGVKMTKPRFDVQDGKLVLLPNPLQSPEDIRKLMDPGFIPSLGKHDWWFNQQNNPVLRFPYTRLLFNKQIWLEVKHGKGDDRIDDLNPRPWEDLWEDTHAPEIMTGILDSFVEEAKALGAEPVILLLTKRKQVGYRVAAKRNPSEVDYVLQHCRGKGYRCFDATTAMAAQVRAPGMERGLFKNHPNARGNKIIAEALAEFLADLVKEVEEGASP